MTLADHITRHLRVPFFWGKHDCCTFAAGWVKCKTGIDHLAALQKWSGPKSAARVVRSLGGMEKLLSDRFQPIPVNLANDGDLALYKGAVCIFSGPHIVGPGPDGLTFIDRTHAECAWSVSGE